MSEVVSVKVGGRATSTPEAIQHSLDSAMDVDFSVLTVSAPGELDGAPTDDDIIEVESKVTKMLRHGHKEFRADGEVSERTLDFVTTRFADNLDGFPDARKRLPRNWIDAIPTRVREAARSGPGNASVLGETIQEEFIAAVLGIRVLRIESGPKDLDVNPVMWRAFCEEKRARGKRAVVGGNKTMRDGHLAEIGTGGSDLTGSLLAYGYDADYYLNLTDGPALSGDPRILDKDRLFPVPHLLADETREASIVGTSILHPDSVVPLMKSEFNPRTIPAIIRGFDSSNGDSTLVDENVFAARVRRGQPVIATRIKGMNTITAYKPGMRGLRGGLEEISAAFADAGVTLEASDSHGADGQRYTVRSADVEKSIAAISASHNGLTTSVSNEQHIVALVGYDIGQRVLRLIPQIHDEIDVDKWEQDENYLTNDPHSIKMTVHPDDSLEFLSGLHRVIEKTRE